MSPRIAYAALTAVLIAALAFEVAATDTPWWLVVVFLLGPDIALFLGIGSGSRRVSSIHAPSRSTTRFTGTGGRRRWPSRRSSCRRAGSPLRSPGRSTSRSTAPWGTGCGRPRAFSGRRASVRIYPGFGALARSSVLNFALGTPNRMEYVPVFVRDLRWIEIVIYMCFDSEKKRREHERRPIQARARHA